MKLSPHKSGMALGGLLGLWHALWATLVALHVAQSILDWVFRLHMIQPVYRVAPFDFFIAITLIIITALIGYMMGYVFALIWNVLHKT